MPATVTLRKFSESELIITEDETKLILKFIFKSQPHSIDQLKVTNKVREFAQGLLVEAIDASYAMGFVESIFRATTNPAAGAKKAISKFAKKAAWQIIQQSLPQHLHIHKHCPGQ